MKLIYRCLCLVFGAILGTGCGNSNFEPEYGPLPEYGVPVGTVKVDGTVVDTAGTPLEGIQLQVARQAVVLSDAQGHWGVDRSMTIPCAQQGSDPCALHAEDLDGPANGGDFQSADLDLDLEQTQSGQGNFDQGVWEQHDVEVVLEEKPAAEERP